MIDLKSDLYALLGPLVAPETIIFADQNSPRPALPYWTMRVQTQRALGSDYYAQEVNDDGEQIIDGVREITLNVQRYGADSDLKVAELRDNLSKTSVLEAWRLKDLALYETGDVLNVTALFDGSSLEPRAALDLFIRFGSRIIDTVGVIETLEIEADYITEGPTPNPDLSETIVVVL